MIAKIIKANGKEENINKLDIEVRLEWLQKAVQSEKEKKNDNNAIIEFVHMPDSKTMVINENGKNLQLPVNQKATKLFHEAGKNPLDFIVGDVMIIDTDLLR